MKKEVTAKFTLLGDEINEAFYDVFVRKMKGANINAAFSPKDIKIDFNDFLEVSLTIIEEKEIN